MTSPSSVTPSTARVDKPETPHRKLIDIARAMAMTAVTLRYHRLRDRVERFTVPHGGVYGWGHGNSLKRKVTLG